jgi:hypothetical protein
MHVFINDREVGPLPETDATVGEIIEAVAVHIDPDEIVTALELDGVVYSAGEEERYAQRRASAVRRLVVITQTPRVFGAAMRAEMAAALSVVAAKVEMVVDLFRSGDERGANRLLAALMEELRLVLVLDHQLATLDGAPAAPALEDVRALLAGRLAPTLKAWSQATERSVGGAAQPAGGSPRG